MMSEVRSRGAGRGRYRKIVRKVRRRHEEVAEAHLGREASSSTPLSYHLLFRSVACCVLFNAVSLSENSEQRRKHGA
jgi:hypothetical protein